MPTTTTATIVERLKVNPPEEFSFEPKDWPAWKRKWEHFYVIMKLDQEPEEYRIHTLVYSMGSRADEVISSLQLSPSDAKVYKTVLDKLEAHFVGKRNTVYERAIFGSRNQFTGETIEQFATTLHMLSENCEFSTLRDDLVRDRLILGIRDRNLSQRLMLEDNLTLAKALEICKTWENVTKQSQELHSEAQLDRISTGKLTQPCKRCGSTKKHPKECPAKNSKCHKCHQKGHWANTCSSRNYEDPKSSNISFLGSIGAGNYEAAWSEDIKVGSKILKFRLDSGAEVTAIPMREFKQNWPDITLSRPDRKLMGPAGNSLRTIGMAETYLGHKDKSSLHKVYVVKNLRCCLLSLQACKSLGLIQRGHDRMAVKFSRQEERLDTRSRRAQQLDVRTGWGRCQKGPDDVKGLQELVMKLQREIKVLQQQVIIKSTSMDHVVVEPVKGEEKSDTSQDDTWTVVGKKGKPKRRAGEDSFKYNDLLII